MLTCHQSHSIGKAATHLLEPSTQGGTAQEGQIPTLDTLAADYRRFVQESKADLANAKAYNNVIA